MKRFIYLLSIFILLFSIAFSVSAAEETAIQLDEAVESQKIEYALFHLETCPHCRDEIAFLEKTIIPKYGEYIDLKMYEVSSPENQHIFAQYGSYYNTQVGSVPLAFVDGKIIRGYGSDDTTGKHIIETIEQKLVERGIITSVESKEGGGDIRVPILGAIDSSTVSLPLLTIVLGFLDGFNPCAMWVLLFLISLLLGMKDKKRMWLLGSIFIVASGAVYFVFMAAWLQFLLFIGMITAIRLIIGFVAMGVGGFQLRDWWKNRKADGVVCKVSKNDGAKNTFDKIKNIVHKKSLWLSILGIIILGFSVNLVELACSAGFPAIFTQVLALNELPMWQRYMYMLGYILFYMLDDIIVFAIAMLTLQSKGVGGKYATYANVIGGGLIFVLGLLLILKPEWLMFG